MQTPAAPQQPTSVASPLLKEPAVPSRALTDHSLLLPPQPTLLWGYSGSGHRSGTLDQAVGNKV